MLKAMHSPKSLPFLSSYDYKAHQMTNSGQWDVNGSYLVGLPGKHTKKKKKPQLTYSYLPFLLFPGQNLDFNG